METVKTDSIHPITNHQSNISNQLDFFPSTSTPKSNNKSMKKRKAFTLSNCTCTQTKKDRKNKNDKNFVSLHLQTFEATLNNANVLECELVIKRLWQLCISYNVNFPNICCFMNERCPKKYMEQINKEANGKY